jgi:acyl carrier protein
MSYPEVEKKVKEILADKLNIDIAKITPDSLLVDNLGMDSFGSVEMLFELEEKFGIKIPDADIEKAKTVKDIVDYMAEKTSVK